MRLSLSWGLYKIALQAMGREVELDGYRSVRAEQILLQYAGVWGEWDLLVFT